MLWVLIKKEILEAILTSRFFIASLLCLVLIPVGMYVNLKQYEQRLADYQEATRLYEQRAKGNIDMDFIAEGYRPPSVLSIFSVGLEYLLPNKIMTSRDRSFSSSNESGINNPQSVLFGKVDLLFNVSFIISLLALIFSFNAVSGEKEGGTLRQIVSNPIPRWQIICGKMIGNYLVLIVPFACSILVALIVLDSSAAVSVFSAAIFLPFLLILIVTLLFILVMFNIGLFVSTLTDRSITSMVTLLFVWVMLILAVPKTSPMVAEIVYPVPSRQVINLQQLLVRQNVEKELDAKRRALYDQIIGESGYKGKGISVPGRTDEERAVQARYDEAKKPLQAQYELQASTEIMKIEDQYKRRQHTQALISMNLSRLSPVSVYSYIVTELASTGVLEMTNLDENAKRFQNEVKQEIYDKFEVKSYGGTGGGSATTINYAEGFHPDKASVPQMHYRSVPLSQAVESEWFDMLLVTLYAILFFAASYVSFLRYDVR